MPDGDILTKSVSRNWVEASRLAFNGADDAIGIRTCEKVLARELNEHPWRDLASATRDIVDAALAGDHVVNRRRLRDHLHKIDAFHHANVLTLPRSQARAAS